MRSLLALLLLTIPLLTPIGPTRAAEELDWECTGPWGGFIFRVQVDETNPERVLAFTTRGNFLSTDAGASWRLVAQRHHPFPGSAMLFSGGRLWLADEGVLRSSKDGGGEWRPEARLDGLLLGRACIPGDPPRVLWASSVMEGPKRTSVVVGGHGRVSRKIGDIPDWDYRLDHRDTFRVHPAAPSKLRLVVSMYEQGTTWFFGSEDAGETWERWSAPLFLNAVAPVPGRPDEWLGAASPLEGKPSGVVRSVDGGRTWNEFGESPRLRGVRTLIFRPTTRALLLGTFTEGVLESPDLGKTLLPRGEGLGIDSVCSIAADPRRKERLYAGNQSGLYRSDDGGKCWKWASKGMAALQSTGIHVLPGDRVLLLEYHQGARVSADGGRTWPVFAPGWKERYGRLLGAFVCGDLVVADTGGAGAGAAVSRDAGGTWARSELSMQEWILGIPDPKSIFAARKDGSILRSRDGIHFEKLTECPKGLGGHLMRIIRLAEDRVVILSTSGSATFEPDTGKIGGIAPLPEESYPEKAAADPFVPDVLWMGTRDGRLHRRKFTDAGWRCSVDRQGGAFVGLVGDPERRGRLLACFVDGTLLVSENGGDDWKPLEDRPSFRTVNGVAVTSDRRLLLVADGAVRVLGLASLDD